MPRTKKCRLQVASAAAAHVAKARKKSTASLEDSEIECTSITTLTWDTLLHEDEDNECGWDGTVNHVLMSNLSDSDFEPDSNTDTEFDFDLRPRRQRTVGKSGIMP